MKTPAGSCKPGAPAQALTKDTSLLPSAGKQSAGPIPTSALKRSCCFCPARCSPPKKSLCFLQPPRAVGNTPSARREGAQEAGKRSVMLLPHSLATQSLPQGSSGVSCPRHHPRPQQSVLPVPSPGAGGGAGPVPSGSSREISPPQTGSFPARRLFRRPPGHASARQMRPWHRPKRIRLRKESSAQAARVLLHPQSPQGIPPAQHRSPQTALPRAKTSQEV